MMDGGLSRCRHPRRGIVVAKNARGDTTVAMRLLALGLGCFLTAAYPIGGSADEKPLQEITIDTITKGGELDGCAINFKVASQDFTYTQGRPIAVIGSLNWKVNSKGAILLLKVLGFDFVPDNDQPLRSFSIPHSFLVLNDVPQLPDKPMKCDNPDGYCGLYFTKSKPFDVMQAFAQGGETAVIKYNRKADGMDAPVALPRLTGEQNFKFATCVQSLLEKALSGK